MLQRSSGSCLALAALLTLGQSALTAQVMDSAWTIHAGTYAGAVVAISSASASGKSSRFWRLSTINGNRRVVGWNPSALPARVAFRPGLGITAADSSAFWTIILQMEEDFGMRLFTPASLDPGADPEDVIVVDAKPMFSDEGMTLVTWSAHGSLYEPRVFLRSIALLRDQRVVTHELMHALGFGHTAAWHSVMNSGAGAPSRLTVKDVAYAQHALYSRRGSEIEDLWATLALARERLRW